MLEMMKNESNITYTENGAATNKSTGSDCLDLFSTIGGLRYANEKEVVNRFIRAYTENPDLAMKILFFARDVREGLGERKIFRSIIKWLASNHPEVVKKNLSHISEYGRYDDIFVLFDTPCEEEMLKLVEKQLDEDILSALDGNEVSLLGKWLPSINTSNKEAVRRGKRIARFLNRDEKSYRQLLTTLRSRIKIIENNLREKDYSFDYSKQPSRAMFKYRDAFYRNDCSRYEEYLRQVSRGEVKLNTKNVYPYELVDRYLKKWAFVDDDYVIPEEECTALNATWESLEDFAGEDNTLVVVDGSGSMYMNYGVLPASVAFSLGLYFAERTKGAFKNHFIQFSSVPELLEVKGDNFVERLKYLMTFDDVADTNLEAVFQLILNTAVENDLSQDELPKKLVIVSDMEFNYCITNASATNFENAKEMFEEKGYALPEIVFWNVASRNRNQPVRANEQGVVLVSGVTPRIFQMVAGEIISPYDLMMEVLGGSRYEKIVA